MERNYSVPPPEHSTHSSSSWLPTTCNLARALVCQEAIKRSFLGAACHSPASFASTYTRDSRFLASCQSHCLHCNSVCLRASMRVRARTHSLGKKRPHTYSGRSKCPHEVTACPFSLSHIPMLIHLQLHGDLTAWPAQPHIHDLCVRACTHTQIASESRNIGKLPYTKCLLPTATGTTATTVPGLGKLSHSSLYVGYFKNGLLQCTLMRGFPCS